VLLGENDCNVVGILPLLHVIAHWRLPFSCTLFDCLRLRPYQLLENGLYFRCSHGRRSGRPYNREYVLTVGFAVARYHTSSVPHFARPTQLQQLHSDSTAPPARWRTRYVKCKRFPSSPTHESFTNRKPKHAGHRGKYRQ
jgi:hypothetical protein